MTEIEIKNFFKELNARYGNKPFENGYIELWTKRLVEYDYEDVIHNFRQLMNDERYSFTPPQLEIVLRGLAKSKEKEYHLTAKFYCKICNRLFDNYETMRTHEDRCSAIELKSQKYNWDFNLEIKKMLYQLSQPQFDKFYDNFLRTVLKMTTGEEKDIIETILNLPSVKERENK